MKKMCLLFIFSSFFFFPHFSFTKDENTIKNSITIGYHYSGAFVNGITFRSGSVGNGLENLNGGYIGIETLLNQYIAIVNTFYFGYAFYSPDNPYEELRNSRTNMLYDLYRTQSIGFTFNYDIAVRFFLGIPYIYLDVGFGFGTKQTEYSHLERQIVRGNPHVFLVDKIDFSFESSAFLSLGFSIPFIDDKLYFDMIALSRFNLYDNKYYYYTKKQHTGYSSSITFEALAGFKVVL